MLTPHRIDLEVMARGQGVDQFSMDCVLLIYIYIYIYIYIKVYIYIYIYNLPP